MFGALPHIQAARTKVPNDVGRINSIYIALSYDLETIVRHLGKMKLAGGKDELVS
jgi:hypothetical protein